MKRCLSIHEKCAFSHPPVYLNTDFGLGFYGPVNTVAVMSNSQLTYPHCFLGRLNPLSSWPVYVHKFSLWQLQAFLNGGRGTMTVWRNNFSITLHKNYCMYLDRQAWANSVDPDETLQNAASYQGLYCLPLIQQFLSIYALNFTDVLLQ